MKMMNRLIKLQDKFILVSDEEIPYNPNGGTNGDFICISEIHQNFVLGLKEGDKQYVSPFVKNVGNCKSCRRIISETPDFSLLSEVDREKIGLSTIDLTKLCYYDQRNPDFQIKEEFGYDKEDVDATGNFAKKDCSCDNCFYGRAKLTEQLITAQSLNEKKYSEEDMREMFEFGKQFSIEDFGSKYVEEKFQSLSQPKVFDIEIEVEYQNLEDKWVSYYPFASSAKGIRPKITNNQIKIIKVL